MSLTKDFNFTSLQYKVGHYVKIKNFNGKKFKGYILDVKPNTLIILATNNDIGIKEIDIRTNKIKIISDRTPEGIELNRYDLKEMNIKLSAYSISLFAIILSLNLGIPFLGIGIMGAVVITAAFLEDTILNKGGLL